MTVSAISHYRGGTSDEVVPLAQCPSEKIASLQSRLATGVARLESTMTLCVAPIREVPHVDSREPPPIQPGQASLPE
jgi:hypothetical protein